jgi:hypothetical protein
MPSSHRKRDEMEFYNQRVAKVIAWDREMGKK